MFALQMVIRKLLYEFYIIILLVTLSNGRYTGDHELYEFFEMLSKLDYYQTGGETVEPLEDVIRKNGYPAEVHNVTTEDGYILTVHRIPYGRNESIKLSNSSSSNQPVFVQHGLLGSSAMWITGSPENSLGYILADAGYDVWLGNCRGNTFSRKHVNLSADFNKEQFWDFSFHEMGYYDLPAVIDAIINTTNKKEIVYIGHSMGTTMFYVMASSRPEYNPKIMASFSLAPVAYIYHQESPIIKLIEAFHYPVLWLAQFFRYYEVLPHGNYLQKFNVAICFKYSWLQSVCDFLLSEIVGFDSPELNNTMLPIIMQYAPAGTSLKNIHHFGQLIAKERDFQLFDYGHEENLIHYGQLVPPPYPLSNITSPLYMYYSDNDFLADPEDVEDFLEALPSVEYKYKVPYKKFNHFDFIWAIHVKQLVYNDLINELNKINLELRTLKILWRLYHQ